MPIVIELSHDVDVEVLKSYLEALLRSYRLAPISHSMPKIERESFQRTLEALKRAKGSGIAKSVPETVYDCSAEPFPKRATSGLSETQAIIEMDRRKPTTTGQRTPKDQRTVKAQSLVLCGAHPNYTAQRKPRTGCAGCWAAYRRTKGDDQETEATK